MLRCKPGDLAVVTGLLIFTPGLRGRFVIVDRLVLPGEEIMLGITKPEGEEPSWWCRAAVNGATLPMLITESMVIDVLRRSIADDILRPIRPNGAEDESTESTRPREVAHG
jgi:hypothetical protein